MTKTLGYQNSPNCPHCGAPPNEHEVRNYDMMWGDGEVYCKRCKKFVRHYDRDR